MSTPVAGPVIVLPMSDPDGILFPQLETITPQLKRSFLQAYLGVPLSTAAKLPAHTERLLDDPFFDVQRFEREMPVGDEFWALYSYAGESCSDQQLLHLCYVDRVAYALQSEHRHAFVQDVSSLTPDDAPLLFTRSATAWETHPRNYRELEQVVTTASEWILGRSLDFAWCHLALTARQLKVALSHVSRPDISIVAALLLQLADEVQTREVDWLAWEDPFIFGRDAGQLKAEREASFAETRKRLGYGIPMLQMLEAVAKANP